jgi:hypothetical protein
MKRNQFEQREHAQLADPGAEDGQYQAGRWAKKRKGNEMIEPAEPGNSGAQAQGSKHSVGVEVRCPSCGQKDQSISMCMICVYTKLLFTCI